MTLEQRQLAKNKLKTRYGAKLTTVIADKTGFSRTYVRDWFRVELGQPLIERTVLTMLIEQREEIDNVFLRA